LVSLVLNFLFIFFSGNSQLVGLTEDLLKNKHICAKHFTDNDFKTVKKHRLKDNAVPVHYKSLLNNNGNLRVLTPTKTYSNARNHQPATTNSPCVTPCNSPKIFEHEETDFIDKIIDLPSSKTSPITLKLKKKVSCQKKEIYNMRRKLSRSREKVRQSKFTVFTLLPFLSFLSITARTFVVMQIRGKRRTIYSQCEKQLAISLYYKSPSCYKFLRKKGVILPSTSTIQKWIGQNTFKTGVDDNIKTCLKLKCDGMDKKEKKCLVAFDEMSIKKCLEYNKKLDIIEGFEDLGPLGRQPKEASHVLVFSIRGIYSSWKYPLAYFFSHSATSGKNLQRLILYILNFN